MLTTSVVHKGLQRKLLNPLARGGYALKKLLPIAIDLLDRTASSWTPPDISPASPAYLQVRTTRHTHNTHGTSDEGADRLTAFVCVMLL